MYGAIGCYCGWYAKCSTALSVVLWCKIQVAHTLQWISKHNFAFTVQYKVSGTIPFITEFGVKNRLENSPGVYHIVSCRLGSYTCISCFTNVLDHTFSLWHLPSILHLILHCLWLENFIMFKKMFYRVAKIIWEVSAKYFSNLYNKIYYSYLKRWCLPIPWKWSGVIILIFFF